MKWFAVFGLLLKSVTPSFATPKTEAVEDAAEGVVFEGFVGYDDAVKGKRPGVLVIHDGMGTNEFAKGRALELAKPGYVAFAGDMYGKRIRPKNNAEASVEARKVRGNRELFRVRARATRKVLQSHPLVNAEKVATIGYCFGGTGVLEPARSGADIAGA